MVSQAGSEYRDSPNVNQHEKGRDRLMYRPIPAPLNLPA